MPMTEDLSVFFSSDEFAVEATLTGDATPRNVIFDVNGSILEQLGVETQSPAAICPAAQWPSAAQGQTLTIAGTPYKVRSVQLLDDGAVKLLTLAR